jgi:hypothetical protein
MFVGPSELDEIKNLESSMRSEIEKIKLEHKADMENIEKKHQIEMDNLSKKHQEDLDLINNQIQKISTCLLFVLDIYILNKESEKSYIESK